MEKIEIAILKDFYLRESAAVDLLLDLVELGLEGVDLLLKGLNLSRRASSGGSLQTRVAGGLGGGSKGSFSGSL